MEEIIRDLMGQLSSANHTNGYMQKELEEWETRYAKAERELFAAREEIAELKKDLRFMKDGNYWFKEYERIREELVALKERLEAPLSEGACANE